MKRDDILFSWFKAHCDAARLASVSQASLIQAKERYGLDVESEMVQFNRLYWRLLEHLEHSVDIHSVADARRHIETLKDLKSEMEATFAEPLHLMRHTQCFLS